MKKLITPVGASIFENYLKNSGDKIIHGYYEDLKEKSADEWENEKDRCEKMRIAVDRWVKNKIKSNQNVTQICAEIKSLLKSKERLKDKFHIYLLCSDTILSKLAGEIIRANLEQITEFEDDDISLRVIKKLQIWDLSDFKKGMSNLISEIYEIARGYWKDVIINITGGYKATVPFLTILAQINQCSIYYIFEDTDSLIEIPNMPLTMEWLNYDELLRHMETFERLHKGIYGREDYEDLKRKDAEFLEKYGFLVWSDNEELAELNPIGEIIYNKCKEKYLIVLVHKEEWEKIDGNEKLRNIVFNQFSDDQLRSRKTEIKRGHIVFDAGNNPYRIFYREKDGQIWIYKVFDDHNEYERYLASVGEYKNDLIERSKESFILKTIRRR